MRLLLERFGAHRVGDSHATHARPPPRSAAMGGASRSAAGCPTERHPAAEAHRPDREVQAEHDVLVVERDAERLLDPAQPQVQRLALQVQRPRRLGLAPARGQVGLERLQQRARARRAVAQQRAELLLDERARAPACRAGRAAGRRRPGGARRASARPAARSPRPRSGARAAAPARRRPRTSAGPPIASAASAGPSPCRSSAPWKRCATCSASAASYPRAPSATQDQQVDVARAEQDGEARSRTARRAGRRRAASR